MAANTRATIQRTARPKARHHGVRADFVTRIDIAPAKRARLQALLDRRLADALDLHSQTKQAHWNVKGPNFHQFHLLFDGLAEKVEGHADLFAERITALGGVAKGTVRMAAAGSSIPEFPAEPDGDLAFVDALAERFALYGAGLRRAIDEAAQLGDQATADIFTEATRAADQALYLLESHLQGTAAQ